MKEKKVEIGEYKKAGAPYELYTGGLGPCIALGAIYKKRGYLAHYPSYGHDYSARIDPLFRDLRKDVKDNKKCRIYVVGGEFRYDDEDKEEVIKGRNIILEKIKKYGFQEAIKEIKFCPTNHMQSLKLILSAETAYIEQEDLTEYILGCEDQFLSF